MCTYHIKSPERLWLLRAFYFYNSNNKHLRTAITLLALKQHNTLLPFQQNVYLCKIFGGSGIFITL
ncbi:hypothetical protein C1N53_00120 [Pontibacter sp. SGAir0037]|nr:hypothetical protein C1N53_00120 [Pontibacter sp. SGAir0037]